jgi:uncharacterized membrane protein (DUF4010 family)
VSEYEPFLSLGVAAAAGLLIGLERERSRPEDGIESFVGGARTHPLFALVGALSALAARQLGPAAVVVPFLGLVVLLAVNYAGDVRRNLGRGITSEAAFLLSFLLGVLALSEGVVEPLGRRLLTVAAVAVVATFTLSSKPVTHALARRISREDLTATLTFLVVVVVVLPLLPDQAYGPYRVLNPFQIGVLLVLISGISFLGYVAVRLLGPQRGLGVTGLVGGLVSSTAVTLSLSGRARQRPEAADPVAMAVVLASTVMFARVLAIAAVVNRALLPALAPPLVGATLGGLAASWVLWRRARAVAIAADALEVRNPFELGRALQFALLFAVVLLGSRAATEELGAVGTYAAGVVAGSTDVDAITLSMARLGGGAVPLRVAATTVFLGVVSNTVVKGVLAAVVGGAGLGRRVGAGFLASFAAGAVGLAAAWWG